MTLIIDPPTRRRSNGATMRLLDAKGVKYDMVAGGRLKVRYEKIGDKQWIGDASQETRIRENVQRAADAVAAKTGRDITVNSSTGQLQPGPLSFQIQIDNFAATREMMKWMIELVAMDVFDRAARHRDLLPERAYVAGNIASPFCGYLERSLVPELYDGLESYVFAAQSPDETIYWEASAYGGLIAVAGRTSPVSVRFSPVLYRVDPVTGANVTERPNVIASNVYCGWLSTPTLALTTRAVKRMELLMNHRHGTEDLIDECYRLHFPGTGETITDQHITGFSRCVAERFVQLNQRLRGDE